MAGRSPEHPAPPDPPEPVQPAGKDVGKASVRSPARKRDDVSPMALLGAGMELAVVVVVLALGGHWLDQRWGTDPLLLLVGLGLGLVGGIYNLWRIGRRFF